MPDISCVEFRDQGFRVVELGSEMPELVGSRPQAAPAPSQRSMMGGEDIGPDGRHNAGNRADSPPPVPTPPHTV